jgi:hypothetical protein
LPIYECPEELIPRYLAENLAVIKTCVSNVYDGGDDLLHGKKM